MSCQVLLSFFAKPKSSDATALWRPATIVRHRRHVFNGVDVQPRGSQRANGGFTPRSGSLDAHFNGLQTVLIARDSGGGSRSLLRGVGRALARALETDRACRGPTDGAAFGIGKRHDRVVERRLNADDAVRHDALFFLLAEFLLPLGSFRRRSGILRYACILRFFCHARYSPLQFCTAEFLLACR